MEKRFYVLILLLFSIFTQIQAGEFGMGADIFSRYVWRGTDFGNTPAVQPFIAFAHGPLEIGAWSSWSVTGAPGGNENDLYFTYSISNFNITVSDYFFPAYTGDDQLDDYSKEGGHTIELSGGFEFKQFSFLVGSNIAGNDPDNSMYFETGCKFYNTEELTAAITAGLGNGFYTVDTDFNLVNLGVTLSKDKYSAAYIINPDQNTSFLVFGISL